MLHLPRLLTKNVPAKQDNRHFQHLLTADENIYEIFIYTTLVLYSPLGVMEQAATTVSWNTKRPRWKSAYLQLLNEVINTVSPINIIRFPISNGFKYCQIGADAFHFKNSCYNHSSFYHFERKLWLLPQCSVRCWQFQTVIRPSIIQTSVD